MLSQQEINQVRKRINGLKASKISKFFYYCLPFRKKVITDNIKIVFTNQLTDLEQKKLACLAYDHFLSCVYEIITGFIFHNKVVADVNILGLEQVIKVAQENKEAGIVLLTGHFGAFETAPALALKKKQEFRDRVYIVRKILSNKFIQKILFRHYEQAGLRVIPQKNAIWSVINKLENRDIIILVIDQFAGGKKGIEVNFFGKPCHTFKLPAKLAQYTGAIIFPIKLYYDQNGKHTIEFHNKIPWIVDPCPNNEIKRNTEQYNKVMERFIIEHPEQWWWLHRRWKGKHNY